MTKKINKKTLKRDKFLNFMITKLDSFKKDKASIKKKLYLAGIICLIIFVGFSYLKGQKREAETLYAEALRIYHESNNEEGYKKAKEIFKKAVKFKQTKAGKLSLLYAGNCCSKLKEYQEALNYYKIFTSSFKEYPLTALGLISLANTAEELNNFKEAINSYKKLINLYSQSNFIPYAMIRLAKCYQEIKNTSQAEKTLKEVIKKYHKTNWEFDASFALNTLK
ncbi:tetratricopeptide repeat protein [bacterium]|nr:tetratricopeptide repeat protein [bacterium]